MVGRTRILADPADVLLRLVGIPRELRDPDVAAHRDPCTGDGFLGDYFGLAVSARNVYALMVSTHDPSSVAAVEGGPVYYQQQVLAKVPRAGFGSGY